MMLIERMYSRLALRLPLHVAFWLVYGGLNFYFNTISYNLFADTRLAWLDPVFNVTLLALFYYPLVYFLWPVFFRRKRYIAGTFLLFIWILIYTFFSKLAERQMFAWCPDCNDILSQLPQRFRIRQSQTLISSVLNSYLSMGVIYMLIAKLSPVLALKVMMNLNTRKVAATALEKENLLLEFNFLKAQINPHFLFNTLNNIHSLIIHQRLQQASATVVKLSGFLRHSLYNNGQDNISLSQEIQLLEDYVDLEKLRLNKTKVTVKIQIYDPGLQVPPLLFITLVENAFKYNADNLPIESFIDIHIEQTQHQLAFSIRNNYDPGKLSQNGGIGLRNLHKRLLHYYPQQHQFTITNEQDIYEVKIQINL